MLKIQLDSPPELRLLDGAIRELNLHAAALAIGAIDPDPGQMLIATAFIRAACHRLDLDSRLSTPASRAAGGPHGGSDE